MCAKTGERGFRDRSQFTVDIFEFPALEISQGRSSHRAMDGADRARGSF